MKTSRTKTAILHAGIFLCVFFAALPVSAKEIYAGAFGYYIDIPEDWQVADAENPTLVSFASPDRKAVFQIAAFDGKAYASAREVQAFYKTQIGAAGDEADFLYQEKNAVIADYTFSPNGKRARGWFVFVSTEKTHFAVSAICEASLFDAMNDTLLSCVDSFAPGDDARLYPGPISQFYNAFPSDDTDAAQVKFGPASFPLAFSPESLEANAVVIEREARILEAATGKEIQNAAWQRYYRVIFRDSYMRLMPAAEALRPLLDKNPKEVPLPAALLSWFQGFTYGRTGTFADFQPPLDCVLSSSGDCDSLGMAYIILLRQLGFDAILLVSEKYSHAIAAVDIPGEGARFDFEGKRYLVADLTSKAALGLINKNTADPANWLPVALGRAAKK